MANVQPDHNVRTPGPGAASTRTDLSGQKQPIRVPTGLPYGAAQQMHNQEQAAAIPTTTQQVPSGPGSAPPGAAAAPAQPDPRAILQLVGSHPTDFPEQPLAGPQGSAPPQQDNETTLAILEDLMHHSKTVDPRVLHLYMQLRGQDQTPPAPNVPLGQAVEGWQML